MDPLFVGLVVFVGGIVGYAWGRDKRNKRK